MAKVHLSFTPPNRWHTSSRGERKGVDDRRGGFCYKVECDFLNPVGEKRTGTKNRQELRPPRIDS